jgi:hypothetical protein
MKTVVGLLGLLALALSLTVLASPPVLAGGGVADTRHVTTPWVWRNTSGANIASVSTTGVFLTGNGTAALPGWAFFGDTDTGAYRIGANNLGISAAGAKVLDVSATGLSVVGTTLSGNGTVSLPGIGFSSDTDTGLYRIGANNIGIAANGAKVVDVATTGAAVTGTLSASGAFTPTGGVAAAGGFSVSPRNWHTGAAPANISTAGTNLTVVVTELYVAEVFVPANATLTGVSVFWGDATEGNAKVMLFDSAGTRVAISASTDVSAHDADAYGTRIPFTGTYAAKGPATYYIGVIADNTSHRINTHIIGNFGAGKITGLVYGTEAGYATITPPTTFTTGLGPIASLY